MGASVVLTGGRGCASDPARHPSFCARPVRPLLPQIVTRLADALVANRRKWILSGAASTVRGVGRIRGHYEWDDDGLTPGRKREGGLHQNLFDKDGNLKGNARFIPSGGDEDEPLVITETVYIPIEQRRRTPEEEAFQQAIADLVSVLIDRGIAKAKPYAQQFWRETARPAIAAQRSRARSALRRRSLAKAQRVAPIAEVAVAEPASQIATAASGRPRMSRAEAQARYLAALAARAFSDEQMRLVTGAAIIDTHDLSSLERSLAELPAAELRAMLESMATKPTLLDERNLAELASILSRLDPKPEKPRRLT